MTSGLDVPRWTNSYGRKNLNRLVGSSYQMVKPTTLPPTNTSTTRSVAESVRLVPVKGVVRPDGFKMPTAWSSFATRANYKPYLYLATTGPYAYYFSGEGYDANHGVGNFPGVTLSDTIVIVSVPTMMQSQARLEAMLKLRDQEIDVGTALGESKLPYRTLVRRLPGLLGRTEPRAVDAGLMHSKFLDCVVRDGRIPTISQTPGWSIPMGGCH